MNLYKSLGISIGLALFLFGGSANAARLYFDAPEAVPFGETFLVPLRIDEEGECINAVDLTVTYSRETLTAVEFSRGDSFLSLWPEPPVIDATNGEIRFAGGVPGGFCGLIEGDTGDANTLGVLVLRAIINPGDITTTRASSLGFGSEPQVLISDGFGTPAVVTTTDARIVLKELGALPKDQWQALLDEDTTPPEAFTVFLQRSASVLDGAPYVTFSTTDKQSGIDYYEVRESDASGASQWVVWPSGKPYPLSDPDASSVVVVKAYDKAKNVRTAEYVPTPGVSGTEGTGRTELENILLGGIGIAVAIMIAALAWAIRRRGSKRKDGSPMST